MSPAPETRAMRLAERKEGPVTVVSLLGRLDAAGSRLLEPWMAAFVARGETRLVLDCSAMTYISSAGLRGVLVGAQACRKAGGSLALAALDSHCRAVLQASGLLLVLDCHDTVEAALAAPGDGAHPETRFDRPGSTRGPPITIGECREETAVVLAPAGRLDGVGAPTLEAKVSAVVGDGGVSVVLDCAGMTYVSSAGLRALLQCARLCRQRGGNLHIAAMNAECLAVLNMSGFHSVIDCHESRDAALAALS